jgi:branched-chain amino acid transport system permease protein
MSLSLIGQLIFDGLATGLVFVVLAGGLVIIMSVTRILFMAYGMFYTIGAYAVWLFIYTFNWPYYLALPAGFVFAGILGALSYLVIFKRLHNFEAGFMATLIASTGLLLILNQGGLYVYGTEPRSILAVFPGIVEFYGITIGLDKLALMGMGIAVIVVLYWVYNRTSVGRAMRAVAFNEEIASLQGINSNRIFMVALGLGTLLAGFAGGILAPSYGLHPAMGNNIIWTVMLMCMLGGMDSLPGAIVGGIIIGQLLSFGQYFMGGVVQIALFVIIGIILYFRPQGLLGRGMDIEV